MNRLFIILFASFLLGCSQSEKDIYSLVKTSSQASYSLINSGSNLFYPLFYHYPQVNASSIYSFNGRDTTISILNFKTNTLGEISLKKAIKDRIGYNEKLGLYLFLENENEVWIDSGVSDSIYKIDASNNEITYVFDKKLDEELFLYDFMDQTYINSTKNEVITGFFGEDRFTFGVFNYKNQKLKLRKKIGELPLSYSHNDFYIKSSNLTVIGPDSLLISYYYSDSVDLYIDNKLEKRLLMKSDSSLVFNAFIGDKMDMNAIRKYFLMNQRYNQLLYDNKKHLFYRIFSYGKKNDGKIVQSKKWSVCIFDSEFKKIHEQEFNNDDYYKGYVALINSELYISNSKKSYYANLKDSSNIVFDAFKLIKIKD